MISLAIVVIAVAVASIFDRPTDRAVFRPYAIMAIVVFGLHAAYLYAVDRVSAVTQGTNETEVAP